MPDVAPEPCSPGLGHTAAVIALAIAMVCGAVLLYYLIDILMVFFLGVVVAAALQPGHVHLARYGVPKWLAVLLIYGLFLATMALIVFLVGPVIVKQITTFAAGLPQQYADLAANLQQSPRPYLQSFGEQLPPFEALTQRVTGLFPSFFDNIVQFATSTVSFFAYFIVVLVIGFYWTMEVPKMERLVVSLVPVARRSQVLEGWHEIETKLGAFVRGQGIAMLAIGAASAVGYYLIGLPNVFALAVLAGLFEAVPLIGPILGAIPAILVALSEGLGTVALVIGFSMLLQLVENNVLIPQVMSRAVGISELLSLFAVLALGALYGILGVFIAIPLTVVIHVILEHLVINPEPPPEIPGVPKLPLDALRDRLHELRHHVHTRFRERDTRVGQDAQSPEYVADAVEQRIEQAAEQVDAAIDTAQGEARVAPAGEQGAVVAEVRQAVDTIAEAVRETDTALPVEPDEAEEKKPVPVSGPALEKLGRVTREAQHAAERAELVLTQAEEATEKRGDKSSQ